MHTCMMQKGRTLKITSRSSRVKSHETIVAASRCACRCRCRDAVTKTFGKNACSYFFKSTTVTTTAIASTSVTVVFFNSFLIRQTAIINGPLEFGYNYLMIFVVRPFFRHCRLMKLQWLRKAIFQ